MTPIADYLRLPFAGLAFASVVSLIPGVFLFRMAGGMVDLITLGTKAPQDIFVQVVADGTTAILIILTMTFGLIVPKACIEHFVRPVAFTVPESSSLMLLTINATVLLIRRRRA